MFANLPLPDVDQSLAELDRVLGRDGMVGVMVCTTIDRRTLDDGLFGPLWEELDRRSAAVFVHPTTPCCTEGVRDFALSLALDFLAETTNAIGRLMHSGVFERYRRIRWIFSHLGGTTPFVVHRFDNYARQFPEARANITEPPSEYLRRLSFDTVSTHAEVMRCAFATFDPGQFVFGTDYPHVPGGLQIFVDTLRAASLSPADQARVAHQNAATLLDIKLTRPEGRNRHLARRAPTRVALQTRGTADCGMMKRWPVWSFALSLGLRVRCRRVGQRRSCGGAGRLRQRAHRASRPTPRGTTHATRTPDSATCRFAAQRERDRRRKRGDPTRPRPPPATSNSPRRSELAGRWRR